MQSPQTEFKQVKYAFVEKSSERNLEVFNLEAIKVLDDILNQHPAFSKLFNLDGKQTKTLLDRHRQLTMLVTCPFSLFTPALPDVASWQSLAKTWASETILSMRDQAPKDVALVQVYQIRHLNQLYIHLIREYSTNTILAPAIFGMSRDLVNYVGNLSAGAEVALLQNIGSIPLFKWRLSDQAGRFWFDHATEGLTRESIAHFLMLSSPDDVRTGNLPRNAKWNPYGLKKTVIEDCMDALMAYGLRASTASEILNRTKTEARHRFKEIHGRSSTCGSSPNDVSWVIGSPKNRVHATFFVWLYRNAAVGNEHAYLPFLASLNLYEKMYGSTAESQYLTVDRAYNLVRSMSFDTSLNVGPCKKCSTHYLLANSTEKIEIADNYACPVCSGRLLERDRQRKISAA